MASLDVCRSSATFVGKNSSCFSKFFFWDHLHWVPQYLLFLPKEEGGHGLIHLASRGATFRLQFIQGLLVGPENLVWRSLAHARVVCPMFKAANKKYKNYLSTPVNISRLATELAHHPDREFHEYLLLGLIQGFNPGVECALSQNHICNNLQSALAESDTVNDLIAKEVKSGFMIGPFDEPPFKIFRISPIGIATRKFAGKKRLIIDLSSPHNSTIPSINSLIPLDEFYLRYHDIEQAVELIKIAGRGAWLAKLDITSAFKLMPIHPDSWHFIGILWERKYYFAVRLTFGCKSSPKIFDMLSEAICWILSNNYAIPHLIHLLDDFLIISPPRRHPSRPHPQSPKGFFRARDPHRPGKNPGSSHVHRISRHQSRLR